MKLWVGFGSAIAATSILRNHGEPLHFFDSQLVDLCCTKGKKAYIYLCSVRSDTSEILHATPRTVMSDKGLNLLLHSCCDLGLLSWQPVDFSDCTAAEDEEGLGCENSWGRAAEGFASPAGCRGAGCALVGVWLCTTDAKGNIATHSSSAGQPRTPLGVVPARHRVSSGTAIHNGDNVPFHAVCKERGDFKFF